MKSRLNEMGIDTNIKVGDQFFYNRDGFSVIYECVEIKKEIGKNTEPSYCFEPNPKEYTYRNTTYPYVPCSMKIEFLYDFLLRKVWQRVTTK